MEDQVLELLKKAKIIAVIGLSDDPDKPSYGVSRYLQESGYRVVPVNPQVKQVLGEKAYPTLSEAAQHEKIDIVDVFRRPDALGPLAWPVDGKYSGKGGRGNRSNQALGV